MPRILMHDSALVGLVLLLFGSCAPDLSLNLKGSSSGAGGGVGGGSSGVGGGSSGAAGGSSGAAGGLSGAAGGSAGFVGTDAGAPDGGDRGTCLTCASCTGPDDCMRGGIQNICNTVTDTLAGLCVACLKDTDCGKKPGYVCDQVTLQCVATCSVPNDMACGTQNRTCDVSIGLCVECLDGTDCPDETPICNHECVECAKEADCTPQGKHCWLQRHSCVNCVKATDCPADSVCSGKHLCIPASAP